MLESGPHLALVADDIQHGITQVRAAVERVQRLLAADPSSVLDICFAAPAVLVCLVSCSDPKGARQALKELVAPRPFRLLDLGTFSAAERAAFVQGALDRFLLRQRGTKNLDEFWNMVSARLAPSLRTVGSGAAMGELRAAVHFRSERDFLAEYGSGQGIFVASPLQPELGTRIKLALTLETGQGPIELTGRVVYVRGPDGGEGTPGFAFGLTLTADELDRFEAFMVAVQRRVPWPERSGREFERFPLHLHVEYALGDEVRSELTDNISRGGVFIESWRPSPVGTRLLLRLVGGRTAAPVELQGEVVHSVDATTAAARSVKAGMGVRFVEDATTVRARLDELLGASAGVAGRRALVVDDDRFFRTVLGNLLGQAGFEVLEAKDGDEALRCLMEELLRLDLLVIDLHMPGMSGPKLLDRIRSVGGESDLTIVVLTGTALADEELIAMQELGADEVLLKNQPAEQILQRIEAVLRGE